MHARLPIVLALATGLVSGCGPAASTKNADDFRGPQKAVAQTIDDLATAARKGDARKICDGFVTAALRARYDQAARVSRRGTQCADTVKQSIRDADAFDLDVQTIRISGRRATVTVKTKTSAKADPVDTVVLVEDRGWRLDSVG